MQDKYDLQAINDELKIFKRKACIVEMHRNKNGSWRLAVDIEVEVIMPDGSVVSAWQEVSVKGRNDKRKSCTTAMKTAQRAAMNNDFEREGEQ